MTYNIARRVMTCYKTRFMWLYAYMCIYIYIYTHTRTHILQARAASSRGCPASREPGAARA